VQGEGYVLPERRCIAYGDALILRRSAAFRAFRPECFGKEVSMGVPTQSGFDLFGTYVHLGATGEAPAVEGGDEFWRLPATELDRKFGGWLVSAYHMTGDTRAWETHPSGDELLYLLSGANDVVLEMDDGQRTIELRAGSACVVPRGRWHRQIVRSPGDILSMTFGKGTQHRPV